MRWRLACSLAGCLLASTALAAPRSSNPAFLGIEMQDAGGRGPCMIRAATHDSPAEAAGLRGGDLVLAVDGASIGNCGALLDEITSHAPGDIVQVVPDPGWVSFMWSYPNLIPLPAAEVKRIAATLEPWEFDRMYGAWWDRVIETGAKEAVRRSADRYVHALGGELRTPE